LIPPAITIASARRCAAGARDSKPHPISHDVLAAGSRYYWFATVSCGPSTWATIGPAIVAGPRHRFAVELPDDVVPDAVLNRWPTC
jgi:hypothetical protein